MYIRYNKRHWYYISCLPNNIYCTLSQNRKAKAEEQIYSSARQGLLQAPGVSVYAHIKNNKMYKPLKKTYSCRHVQEYNLPNHLGTNYHPEIGDVGIFEIVSVGRHRFVQTCSKRNISITIGDQVMATFGNDYMIQKAEGYLPENIDQDMHILEASCTVGIAVMREPGVKFSAPTIVKLIGLVTDLEGAVLNTKKIMQRTMAQLAPPSTAIIKSIHSLSRTQLMIAK